MNQLQLKLYLLFFSFLVSNYSSAQNMQIYHDTISYSSYKEYEVYTWWGDSNDNKLRSFANVHVYFKSGELKEVYFLDVDGHIFGNFQSFYLSGKIKEEAFYIKSRRVGRNINYYENGQIESIGSYKDVSCYNEIIYRIDTTEIYVEELGEYHTIITSSANSMKTGIWRYYNEYGLLVRKEEYP